MAAERTIRIKFDGSSAGLVSAAAAAKAEIKSLADDSKKRSKSISDFGASVGRVFSKMIGLAGSLANVGTVLNVIPVLTSTMASLAGVAPLAVAGVFALAGAMVAVKLGADGAKRAFAKLTPTLNTLKSNVSSSFEKALKPAVDNIRVILPKLTTGFQQIATAVGGVATRVTSMLKMSSQTSQLQTILSGTSRVIQNIGAFLAPVIVAFIRIGAVAMPILFQLTSHIGAAGQAFNEFTRRAANDGRLAAWINGAIALFGRIFKAIGDGVALIGQLFGGMVSTGNAATSVLAAGFSLVGLKLGGIPGLLIGTVIPALAQFAKTPLGQKTLQDLGTALSTISTVVSGVMTRAFQVLAPLIDPLAKLFAQLATTLSSLLLPALDFLAPVIENIAKFISENLSWITPLVTAIGLWTAAQWLLNIALDANPIGLVILAIGALIAIVATIITYWTPISGFFVHIWNVVKDAVTDAAKWVWQRLVDAWDFIKGVWSGVTGWFSNVWSGITGGVSDVAGWIGDRFSDAWNFIKGIWNAVSGFFVGIWNAIKGPVMVIVQVLSFPFMLAWNIIKVILLVALAFFISIWLLISKAAVAVGHYVAQVFTDLWAGIKAVWSVVAGFFTEVWNAIVAGLTVIGQAIAAPFVLAWNLIQAAWNLVRPYFEALWSGIVLALSIAWQVIQSVWSTVTGWFTELWNAVAAVVAIVAQWIGQRFSDAWNVIKGVWSVVSGWFSGIWSSITTGVSNAVGVVRGMFSDAWSFIKGVWSGVSSFFSGIWSGIGSGLKSALNSVIRLINGAIGRVNSVTSIVGAPSIASIPYLAKGGTAKAGRSYVVGERGPELFTPGQTGRVTSNAQSFGGSQEINLTLDLGEGISQRVQISIDKNNRATWRTVKAGGRAA